MRNGDVLPIDIMARREDWQNGISLFCRKITVAEGFSVIKPVIFEKHNKAMRVEPFLSLNLTEAQKLIDELWSCGLRPSEGTGSAGSLAATENHLQDMKKIAFKTLKIEI